MKYMSFFVEMGGNNMKLKKWQIILIIVIVVGLFSGMSGDSEKDTTTKQENQTVEKTEEVEKTYKMKETVKVGDVEYVVSSKKVSSTVGSEYFNEKAQGKFLTIDISIKNCGDEPLTVSDSFFKILNGEKEYGTSSDATIYLDDSIIYKDVNPDVTLKGQIIFDVPEDVAKSDDIVLQVQTGVWGTETEKISLK